MSKIKITEPGWAGFSDQLGGIEFVDGVSVEIVNKADAAALAAIVAIEWVDTGVNPSVAQQILDNRENTAPIEGTVFGDSTPAGPVEAKVYTEAELGEIADKGGIKAIRVIADPLGLKDNSVKELIAKILADQSAKAEAAAAAAAAAAPAAPAAADATVTA